jgi:hypothetical protein
VVTRKTNARVAGFMFLFYTATAIARKQISIDSSVCYIVRWIRYWFFVHRSLGLCISMPSL